MFSYDVLCDLAKIYQQERLEEARMARLVKEARAGRPGLRDRLLVESGELLIIIGHRLKDGHGLRMQPRPNRQRTLSGGMLRDC